MYNSVPSTSEPGFPGLLGRLRGFGRAKHSRDVERLSKPEDDDVLQSDACFAFLRNISTQIIMLSATTWLSMPLTTMLMWNGFTFHGYAFMATKFISVIVLQFWMCKQVNDAVADGTLVVLPEFPDQTARATDQSCSNEQSCGACVWNCCVAIFNPIVTVVWGLIRLIKAGLEAIDPDNDASTVGLAHQSDTSGDWYLFADSWPSALPVVGPFVGRLDLPYVLLSGLVVVAAWQIYLFRHLAVRSHREFVDARALGVRSPYALLHHMSDTGNLLILSEHFQHLWHEVDPAKNIDRYHGYRARVPELVFQGWFTASLLELVVQKYGFKMDRIAPILFSLATTATSSATSFFGFARIFVPWSRDMCRQAQDPKRAHYKNNVMRVVVFMSIQFAASLMIMARVIGIWTCEEHEFLISSMSCSK